MASRTATGSAADGVDACFPAHVLDSPTSLPSHRQAAEKFMPDRHAWQFDPGSELLGVDYTESGDMLVNVSFEPAPKPVWTVPYRDLQVRLWGQRMFEGRFVTASHRTTLLGIHHQSWSACICILACPGPCSRPLSVTRMPCPPGNTGQGAKGQTWAGGGAGASGESGQGEGHAWHCDRQGPAGER